MSSLFERDRSVIGKHIRKFYQEEELDENRTRAKNARHLEDGRIFQVDVYNLNVIIAVGYRVNLKEQKFHYCAKNGHWKFDKLEEL